MDTLLYEPRGGLAWVTLNRPAVRNAINLRMRDELWEVLDTVEADDDVGVLLFRGAGAAFSAGADVSEFGTAPSVVAAREARRRRDLWWRLERFPKPMIATIYGWALGAGLELALYCDLRLAAPESRVGIPEVNLGYIPAAGGTQTVPRATGPGVGMELATSGRQVTAEDAVRMGLVHSVVPREALEEEAERRARSLLLRTPLAIRYAREAIRLGSDMKLEAGLALERRLASILLSTASQSAASEAGNEP